MNIEELHARFNTPSRCKAFDKVAGDPSIKAIHAQGLQGSAAALFLSNLLRQSVHSILVANDLEEAGYLYHDLTQINGDERVFFFPSAYKRAIKYGQIDSANEILRTEVLSKLQESKQPIVVVTYPEAIAEKVVKREILQENTLTLHKGEHVEGSAIIDKLYNDGFERVDYVYEPRQYAIRGSILDIFSYSNEQPYRLDFFGDEIESIRLFEVDTQTSITEVDEMQIVPKMSVGSVRGISLATFVESNTLWAFKDLAWCIECVHDVASQTISEQLMTTGEGDMEALNRVVDVDTFKREILTFKRIEYGTKSTAKEAATLRFDCSMQPIYHKNFDLVSQSFSEFLKKDYTLCILSDSAKQTERLKSIFEDRGDKIAFTPVLKTLHEGFTDNQQQVCYFTDHQIFDRFHKYSLKSEKARTGKLALSLKELQQFEPGDYIVHIDHGVGKFGGLVRTDTNGQMQEVVKLIYQNDDILFVSIHALHKLSKYRGKEGAAPRINKLGSGAWERVKEKTKGKMKDIARDLILLYAKRKEEKGYSFSPDSFLQQELEASFIYEDTPDQLKSTQDVKHDMERDRPMDRLICGDVGFGKTEIAIRAAFKAACDNKQVAVLVPTTVLAFQHYKTFSERLKELPVKVEYLSRARKAADTKAILKQLPEGEPAILIGTHRLIGKDIKFKDLGLLIIDEEQKFGVSVKEKLKQLKVNVDTLTMSATPIPRTLQFSLMGARDLSIISTPPPNRYPIQTEVHPFNDDILKEAINFEMSRNGQVFLVNNRIQQLSEIADRIHQLVPDARVVIGHGQMEPAKLEEIILGFTNHDYDVLLATTIIESGIDMPNANTIIINNAQNYGLSELHQLRGRVGRSNKKAFCYLFAPPLHSLSPDARRRLQAIESFSDLGSGIHIAMQDLDIRGAGNMLGAEQSGFIADLGYETYQKILKEAVEELKTEEFADLYRDEERGENYVEDCIIESDMELLFPNDYIENVSERISLYQELDNMERDTEIERFKARLVDRFGRIPDEGKELIRVVRLRMFAKQLGMEKVTLKQGKMRLYFVSHEQELYFQSPAFGKVINYLQNHAKECQLREFKGKRSLVVNDTTSVEHAVAVLQSMVQIEI